jgi:hypothetical protein
LTLSQLKLKFKAAASFFAGSHYGSLSSSASISSCVISFIGFGAVTPGPNVTMPPLKESGFLRI